MKSEVGTLVRRAAEEDEAQAEGEHGAGEQEQDDFRFRLLRDLRADLRADGCTNRDADRGDPDDVIEQEMADDAEDGRAGEDEMRRGRRDVHGEAEEINHERHVHDAAADAEDGRDNPYLWQKVED